MTFEYAKRRAAALAGKHRRHFAVIDCGGGEIPDAFTVKAAEIAAREYPQDVKFVSTPRTAEYA